MKTLTLFGALAILASSMPAFAADTACPSGNYAVVRESQIKPAGSLEGLKKAMADHAKWYADHGYAGDRFTWGAVLERDEKAHKLVASKDKVMTFHWAASDVPAAKHDAAWAAFVAEYEANSTILSSRTVCMGN